MKKHFFPPIVEVVFAALIWGTSGVFVKYFRLPPTIISFYRMAIPTVILVIYFIIKKNSIFKKDNKIILIASLLTTLRMFLYFVAYTFTSIGNAVIILYTWPIFVTLYSIIFFKEKLTIKTSLALLFAFTGIILIYLNKEFSFQSNDFIGMTAMMGSSAIYALSMIIFKSVSHKYERLEITFFQNVMGAIIFLPFLFFVRPLPEIEQYPLIIFYSVLIGVVAFTLFFSALKKIKASLASNLAYLEILSAIFFGILLFNEKLTWNMVTGGLIIISSVFILRSEVKEEPLAESEQADKNEKRK